MENNPQSLDRELSKHFVVQKILGNIFVGFDHSEEHGNFLCFHDEEDYLFNLGKVIRDEPTIFRNSYGELEWTDKKILMKRYGSSLQDLKKADYKADFIRANREIYPNYSRCTHFYPILAHVPYCITIIFGGVRGQVLPPPSRNRY